MTKAQKIENYIKECFQLFDINYKEYYYFQYEDGVFEDILWSDDNSEISMPAIEHASEVLGISVDDILSRNEKVLQKWLVKYPYFGHLGGYNYAYEKSFYTKEFERLRLLESIFDSDLSEQYPIRYDYADVKKRMIDKLKLLEQVEPGIYHEGATIKKLKISTENFCSYEKIEEMAICFIAMIKTATQLFLKAIHMNLNNEEKNEYNLLVSVLGLRDRFFTSGYLYYNQLMKVKDFYKNINDDTFCKYIIFKRILEFKPWRYSEFINNKKLVQEYLDVIPQAKAVMRDYAMEVTRFKCTFVWSDANPIMFSAKEEQIFSEINAILGEEDIPLDKRAKEWSYLNIDKTDEELNGEKKTAETILSYCRPVKLGGLAIKIPMYKNDPSDAIKHLRTLVGKVEDNNFVRRIIARKQKSGGSSNE